MNFQAYDFETMEIFYLNIGLNDCEAFSGYPPTNFPDI